ncbi:MAG TPA: glycosyltransferase family 2 protein [Gammaproteobacteria bacterium]|nr:glycosyltransferase family 2 protein [Gammaproteobacteria bacterium]
MKLVAHLGVLDEVELVGHVIDHLYRLGVDHLVVFDMGSTDGTLELLQKRAGSSFELVCLRNDTPWDVWQQTAVECVRRTAADWVLFLDGDEFWLPRGGDLKRILGACQADILIVDRFNVVLGPDGLQLPSRLDPASFGELLLYCRRTPNFCQYLAEHPEAAWLGGVPVPKVVGRVAYIDSITMGGHDVVTPAGRTVRQERAQDIVIAHAPISSLARFRRRLVNIDSFLALNPDYLQGSQGWHWRRWAEIHRQGKVEEEYRRQQLDDAELRALRADGAILSAAQLLAGAAA